MAKSSEQKKKGKNLTSKNTKPGKSFPVKPLYLFGLLVIIIVSAVLLFLLNKPEVTGTGNSEATGKTGTAQTPGQATPGNVTPNQGSPSSGQSNSGSQPAVNSPAFKPLDLSKIDPSQSPANDPDNPKVKRRESVNLIKDNKGQIIERTDQNFDKDGKVTMNNRYTYKYDEEGNMTEQRYYAHTPEGVETANTVNFTKWQNKLKTENTFISYDPQGKELSRQKNVYKYNQYGQCIEDMSYSANNQPSMKVEYIYQQGALRGERYTHYNPDGSVKKKESYDYDERGRVINK